MTNSSVAQAQTSSPTTTGVMVILTVKAGVCAGQAVPNSISRWRQPRKTSAGSQSLSCDHRR